MTRERLWQEIAASLYTLYGDREEFEPVIFKFNHLAFPSTRAQFMESKARRDARAGRASEAVAAHSYLSRHQWETVKEHLISYYKDNFSPDEAESAIDGLRSLLLHIERMDCWPEMDRQIPWYLNRGDDEDLIKALEMTALGCSIDTLTIVYHHLSKAMITHAPNFPPVRSSLDDELGEDPDENTLTDLTSPVRVKPTGQDSGEPEILDDSCIIWDDEPSEETEDNEDTQIINDPFSEGSTTQ